MTNLIRNGEFYEGEKDWSVSDPEHVKFNEDDCKITSPGYISQDIIFPSAAEEYALSARMKTAPGFTACVTLTLHPSGKVLALLLENASNWQVLTDWTEAPPGTTGATVKLETKAETGVATSQFGSLELLKLDEKPSGNILEQIVAWWRSLFGARR
ncbi:hypothetical protein [Pseudomonas zeae]|uniref:Uncharacterized protein n=1 Tax=Pseudomonas zeae TaxID=2745510 RepID=A0A9E6TE14_9PSED|nr:hypothetical protein [Pseudomonas zeae]MDX9677362.1 hypothetical protein [Pseudomonas zeae]QXI14334.1 hypothetical protein HU754_013205 [Pseudomonas zeae]